MIIFLATFMSARDQAASLCKVGKMERLLSYFYIVSTLEIKRKGKSYEN